NDERHQHRAFRQHPAGRTESTDEKERDDGSHVHVPGGDLQRRGQRRSSPCRALARRRRRVLCRQRHGDFLKNPPGPGNFPQGRLMDALIGFEKPIVAAVQGAAIGGGTTMLTHCDVVYAGESARFQLPFINLALVPEFRSSSSLPARIGYLRAAELYLLGEPFTAARAAELGLVTRVVPDRHLFATAMETA